MPSFTLFFTGLILHRANDDGSRTAILVHAHHHDPRLIIPVGSRVSEDQGWRGTLIGSSLVYDLHKRVVAIDQIENSATIVDQSFVDRVPRLQEVLETRFDPVADDLENDVKGKKPKDDVAVAYVDYRGGTLSVFDCFQKEADFEPTVAGFPRCIGRRIQFAGRTTEGLNLTLTDGRGSSLVVLGGSNIAIMNTASGKGHHIEYGRLLKSKKKPRTMAERGVCTTCLPTEEETFAESKSDRAEQLSERYTRGLSIECSNSQWP